MIMNRYVVLTMIILLLLGLFGCGKRKESYCLLVDRALNINSNIPKLKWIVNQYYSTDIEDYFALRAEYKDTIYYLRLYKSNQPASIDSDDFYFQFERKHVGNEFIYVLLMDKDTLCFYMSTLDEPSEKIFFIGKYYFLFTDPHEIKHYTMCQHVFFQNHIDSLVKVKGNDLPDLPCDSSYFE